MAEELNRRSTDLPPDAPWWARWFVANINDAWKWGSTWWPALCAAAAELYAENPKEIADYVHFIVPQTWWPHILASGFTISIILRVANLTKVKKEQT